MGQYRVIRKLAAGGMAEVFLGKLVGSGGFEKPVAIKRMLPTLAADTQSAQAFLQEARLCVSLVHPNVVQVFDLGTSGGLPYLVMELVDGPDLHKVLKEARRAGKPLTAPEAVWIAACVADALAYAYEARGPSGAALRVVHRDVNPANVLLSMSGEVKLADFGVAKAADGRETTRGNLVKGKLSYMAPELLRGIPAGHASDIFLAGALLFELLAGHQLLSNAGTPEQILAAVAAHDARQVRLPAGLAPELLPVVQKALAADPAQRFQHARELAAALKAIIARRGWVVGPDVIAAKLAALFPDRQPLGLDSAAGVPLREDQPEAANRGEPPAPARPTSGAAPQHSRLGATGNAPTPRQGDKPCAEPAKGAPTAPRARKRLGEMMVEAGLITQGQLQHLMSRQRLEGGRIGELAVTLDYTSARAVLELLGRQLRVPFISDEKILQVSPPPELLSRFGEEMALRLLALPIGEKDGIPFIAMTEPSDLAKVDMIRFRLGKSIQPVLCTELGVRRAISRFFGNRCEEHKWRQLDPSDPLAILTGRMVDFDEQGRVLRTSETSGSTPINAMSLPAITPATGITPGTPPSLGGTTPAPNGAFAYVVSGVGPDGRPILVPVPLAALQGQTGARAASAPVVAGEPAPVGESKQDSGSQKGP